MKTWIFVGAAALFAMAAVACGSSSSDSSDSMQKPAETPGTTPSSLYERLGSHDGIAKAVDAIVTEELKDPEIASYFFFQVQSPLPAGHPSADQIKECLVAQLGAASGGPETYPTKTSSGFQCRSMTAAHAKLGIPDGVFTKFLMIAASVLQTAGVMDDDIKTVGGVLEGTRADVAQDHSRQDGMFVQPKQ